MSPRLSWEQVIYGPKQKYELKSWATKIVLRSKKQNYENESAAMSH